MANSKTIQQLGYLGLILLVYEGGLSTSFSQLKAKILLSAVVALTGVGVPMGLSFTPTRIASATLLQAFAAGASLCSTSIATTFTIFLTTGLVKARLGVVLSGPAMMDDVAGLVMVQVISNLGGSGGLLKALTVIKPIFVAIGFAVGLLLFCLSVVAARRLRTSMTYMPAFIKPVQFTFLAHMFIIFRIITGTAYEDTSLFAAYLSGACMWFGEFLGEIDEAEAHYESCNTPAQENENNQQPEGRETN
ncbi:hypothetical protein MPDQ_000512 [Monascus purpureus]|uniref:Cation/H+ exchanger transmembrane domain-containing protein n=1 Tax=Monascus purpureus TaxID=5098 RepID=A0A507R147_MONPU|nr:hypothetical protein MPDQ_000512 [Monascus purpureus]